MVPGETQNGTVCLVLAIKLSKVGFFYTSITIATNDRVVLFCFVGFCFVLFLLGCNCLIVKQVRTLPGINLSKCSQNCRTLPVKTYTSLERCC